MKAEGSWAAFRFVLYALAVEVEAEAIVWHLRVAMQSTATSQTGHLDFVLSLPRLAIASDAISRFFFISFFKKEKSILISLKFSLGIGSV